MSLNMALLCKLEWNLNHFYTEIEQSEYSGKYLLVSLNSSSYG